MARTKPSKTNKTSSRATTRTLAPQTSRPSNALFYLVFAVLSAAAAWFLRIQPGLADVPPNFLPQVEDAQFANGLPLRTKYFGIQALDDACRFLVVAFYAGPAGWDKGVRLQQIHFLVNFFAVICVWNVEACRKRNAWKAISFTALFALFYQTVGGAIIIPLYYLFHVGVSSSDAYYFSGREVPLPAARALIWAASIGYLFPTIELYLPGFSDHTRQLLTMLWQPAPAVVNLLLPILAFFLSSSSSSGSKTTVNPKNADLKYLKRIYLFSGVVSFLVHIGVVYIGLTSSDPEESLTHIFIPDASTYRSSTTLGLHYIFQVDEWGCFVPTLIWCWVAVYDILRLRAANGAADVARLLNWAAVIAILGFVAGPGATLAFVWSWREDQLVLVEERKKETPKKRKAI